MHEGWIKLHRSMLNWDWYHDTNTFRLFMHLLLMANHKPKNWCGVKIERGQRLTSLLHLSQETGLSVRSVRTALSHLKSTGEVTSKATSKYTIITICKYGIYQSKESPPDTPTDTPAGKPATQSRHSPDTLPTTNKNDKNDKNDKKPDRKPPSRFEKALFYARSLFNKRPATALDRSETIAARNAKTVLCELTDEDWGYLSLFYQAPQSETFARKSLATFLNNVNGELANAKAWHNNLAPSPSYSRAPDDPADWQRLRDEVCDDLEAQGIPIEKLAGQRTETRYLSLKCSIRDDINAKIKETFA